MASPFPGMDPYLENETHWPAFQHQFMTTLHQMLLPNLGDRYRVRIGLRRYETEQVLFTSIQREERLEEYLEIRQRSDGRLATLVQLVSPQNRTTDVGRREYLALNTEARRQGANLLEIDLLLRGASPLPPPPNGVPPHTHVLALTRGSCPDKVDVATVSLRKPLPRTKLPLGRMERDLILDLGTVFAYAHDQGGFAQVIDYRTTLPYLDDDTQTWVDQILKVAGLRDY